jgi:hypothetical protein
MALAAAEGSTAAVAYHARDRKEAHPGLLAAGRPAPLRPLLSPTALCLLSPCPAGARAGAQVPAGTQLPARERGARGAGAAAGLEGSLGPGVVSQRSAGGVAGRLRCWGCGGPRRRDRQWGPVTPHTAHTHGPHTRPTHTAHTHGPHTRPTHGAALARLTGPNPLPVPRRRCGGCAPRAPAGRRSGPSCRPASSRATCATAWPCCCAWSSCCSRARAAG